MASQERTAQQRSGLLDRLGAAFGLLEATSNRARAQPPSPALEARLTAIGTVAILAAAAVAALTADNPLAGPPHAAVLLRVVIILLLVATGLFALTSGLHSRMGLVLLAAGLYSPFWLLNGSRERLAFSLGVLVSGLAPTVFAYLMVSHPLGRLPSRTERTMVAIVGTILAAAWAFLVLTHPQPPLRTPLLRCAPTCPPSSFFVGTVPRALSVGAQAVAVGCWTAVTLGPLLLLSRRFATASPPVRRSLGPTLAVAAAIAVLWPAFLIARIADAGALTDAFATAYVVAGAAVPLAILLGLAFERLFMGRALADLVDGLVAHPGANPETLMAGALGDPTLTVLYWRADGGTYVDASGAAVIPSRTDASRAVSWVARDGEPLAVVTYDVRLADQERFVQAAAAASLMHLEATRLESDLKATTRQLSASRIRLVDAADSERQRIERDLHDGIQQHLIGLRLKLDLAAEAVREDPARGEWLISSIGRQMDDALTAVRALARGIYPSLLSERGLPDALRSAGRRLPVAVSVRAAGIERYRNEVEVAVYFCCLEAMQNVAKHAGEGAEVIVRLWTEDGRLSFEVADAGRGFDPETVPVGSGLNNMSDRIAAVGGEVTVVSREGEGTRMSGTVPIGPGDP